MSRTAKLVEIDTSKTVVRTLVNCNIGDVPLDPLNPRGQEYVTITLPKYETNDSRGNAVGQYAEIRLGRHIQIFDSDVGSDPIFEGVPIKRKASSGEGDNKIDVYDLGWYLTKANITAPVRNLLVNGNFEAGTTGWTAVGCTMTPVSSPVRRGSTAMRLTATSTFAESYIYQDVVVTGTGVGTALTGASWFNIDTWTGPAIYSRGLMLEVIASGVVETFNDRDGVIDDDTATALDEWQRREATTWVLPDATRTIRVRQYVGNASIIVDEIGLFEPTSLAIAPGSGEDIATTANRIIQFIQNTAYGKSDKRLTTATPPTTGIKFYFPKAWQYADKTPADTALEEIVNLGVDYSFVLTATGSTFTLHYPQMGDDLTSTVTLTFPAPASPGAGVYGLASYDYDEDNDPVETDTTILGEGDGPDREEGHASDAIDAGGLVLEGIESVAPGTTIDKLDDLAAARLALRKAPAKVLTVVTKGAVSVGNGDLVTLDIDDGTSQFAGTWRVVAGKRLRKTDCLELTLNDTPDSIAYDGGATAGAVASIVLDGGSSASPSASVVDGGRAA